MNVDGQTPWARARLLPLAVLVVFGAASLATFWVTRRVVDDQETRLLKERTDAVGALLANSTSSTESSLQVAGRLGSSPDPGSARLFGEVASPLVKSGVRSVAVATKGDAGFAVRAAVGDGPPAGVALTGKRAALAARALTAGKLVSDLVTDERGARLIMALPTTSSQPAVAYQESSFDPKTPIPPTAASPFRELRVALYASKTNDPSRLVVTTEAHVPLTGRVERIPFPLGADTWLLAVGARYPLVGTFAERVPWLLLGGGLLTALLAAAVAEMLVRRRAYALALVTERTRELGETRAFLERMLTAGPALVKRITVPDGRISYVSPNVERIIGVSEEKALVPGFLGSQIHPDDRPGFQAALELVAEGTSTREVHEHRVARGDGQYRWVSATLVPDDTDEDGEAVAVLGYLVDIDDRRGAEQAEREAKVEAERANRSKSEFLSRMSHELRTPLNAILGFAQLLAMDELAADQRESVEQVLRGGRHLLALINEVLDISRIETGSLALSAEAVSVAEVVQETLELVRPLAAARDITIAAPLTGDDPKTVVADRQRLRQVLLNLTSNAVKYNRPGGSITISCARAGDERVRLAVSDTGPGIAADKMERLFVPFDRLGADETGVEGTGIGLALSKGLTELMGGTLTAESTPGEGTTFFVELAIGIDPVAHYDEVRATPPPSPAARHAGTVLYVEDNPSNLQLVERILAHRPRLRLLTTREGGGVRRLVRDERPDVVLLDVHLPDVDGAEVLRRLQADPDTARTPVIMISADATPRQIERLLAAGAREYLTKPLDVTLFLEVLDGLLQGVANR
jgi:PAS domain S-box-containing protein